MTHTRYAFIKANWHSDIVDQALAGFLELIPAADVIAWAAERKARLLLVNDGHRLMRHVDASCQAFEALLRGL